ncbi:asparagine synthase-related protein [Silvibacterium acidisoli]|uniref:asparagine synthase-related protein n=1 Tax=Acidobacteriaceae bacterium ZG23-2 TaxID=2883246 RepID=UPI00406C648D
MSTIFGKLTFDGRPIEMDELTALSARTEHYAPDGSSLFVEKQLGMGYQVCHTHKLSGIEKQPLAGEQACMPSWDGRLDNRDELSGLLGKRASLAADSQIVLEAFERWGENCFAHLLGDWSLALWSAKERSLYLARDHAGSPTLYFEQTANGVNWSTHLETFVANAKTYVFDQRYAAAYLMNLPIGERTPYKGIEAAPAAHWLRFKDGHRVAVRYWTPLFRDKIRYTSDVDYERHFFALFQQAVARRCAPGEPVIAQLSGGLDSSSIVTM